MTPPILDWWPPHTWLMAPPPWLDDVLSQVGWRQDRMRPAQQGLPFIYYVRVFFKVWQLVKIRSCLKTITSISKISCKMCTQEQCKRSWSGQGWINIQKNILTTRSWTYFKYKKRELKYIESCYVLDFCEKEQNNNKVKNKLFLLRKLFPQCRVCGLCFRRAWEGSLIPTPF